MTKLPGSLQCGTDVGAPKLQWGSCLILREHQPGLHRGRQRALRPAINVSLIVATRASSAAVGIGVLLKPRLIGHQVLHGIAFSTSSS
jgi:hypothetical protein